MNTLILSGRFTKESIALWKVAQPPEWRVERVRGWRVPLLESDQFTIYSEPLFAEVVCRQLGLVLLEPSLDWLAQLPAVYLNRKVDFATLAEARQIVRPSFVKPADNKVFDAKVYSSSDELPAGGVFPESLPVLIADPVQWEVEFRCFVLDGRVETLSPYWRDGTSASNENDEWPATDSELAAAKNFAEAVLASHGNSLPPAVVLDVGIIAGRGWSVVEANPAWAAGFYGCDPATVLPVLARSCCKQGELAPEDRRWVINRTS